VSAEGRKRRALGRCLRLLPPRLRTAGALAALLLFVGLALRTYNYLRDPSLWHDEAALILNVLGKGFADLLGPLFFSEAAPPLFLWAERAVVLLLGDSTYALRLLPFLAGCAAVLLFLSVARTLLRPEAVPWAVLLFAFNEHLLWHASEAKPYSLDVFAATALLAVWCRTRRWPLERQLFSYAALAPLVVFLVYPGGFLLGALMLALLPALWRERRRLGPWLGYAALVLSTGTAFLLLYLGPVRAQHNAAIENCWVGSFPPWDEAWWAVPAWAVKSTLDALCYCLAPVGNVLAAVLVIGAVGLWRRGERTAVVLLLAPAGLALLASCLGGYPYCGRRILVYLTPAVVLLTAAGLPPSLAWLWARWRPAAVALTCLALAPVGTVIRSTASPFGRPAIDVASQGVLAELRAGDAVRGNGWEQDYYFRHLGSEYLRGDGPTAAPAGRLWLVVIAGSPEEREATLELMTPPGWQSVERREYYRTTVVMLQAPQEPSRLATVRPLREG
jgi:hypothetical protein